MEFLADESCAAPIIQALRKACHDVIAVAEAARHVQIWQLRTFQSSDSMDQQQVYSRSSGERSTTLAIIRVENARSRPLVRGRCSSEDSCDQVLLGVEIVDDAVAAGTATPCGGLSFETLDVPLKGILLHGKESAPNAYLISWRQLLEVFLRGPGELDVPCHRGTRLMIANRHGEKQRGRGAAPPVQPESA